MVSNTRHYPAPIDRVTVFEDRARILRRAELELDPGRHRLVIPEVSPTLADKSLSIRLSGGAAKITDARAQRRKVVLEEHQPEALRELVMRLEAARLDRTEKSGERDRVAAALSQSEQARRLMLAEWAEDVAWGQGFGEDAEERLEAIAERRLQLSDRLGLVEQDIEGLDQRLGDLERRIETARSPRAELRADIAVELQTESAGLIELIVEYTVPGACWRPEHRAELLGESEQGERRVAFSSQACVWQNTGENWENVELRFSTERPSLGTEPPRLATDRLSTRDRNPWIMVEAREQEIHDAGLGMAEGKPKEPKASGLPGIDDGGEALELTAQQRASVPSDGLPYRAMLHHFESIAKLEYVCIPELAPSVMLKSTLVNTASRPILAGPVHLVRQSGLQGRTRVDFVAAGERFELGWGPLSEVSVVRDKSSLAVDAATLISWHTETVQVRVRLSNLMPTPLRIGLVERIPVSELEKLVIELDHDRTRPHALPDDDGFIHWSLDLAPLERAEVKLVYTVKKHSDVAGI